MKLKNLFFLILLFSLVNCAQIDTPEIFEQTQKYPEELQQLHQNVLKNLLEDKGDFNEVQLWYSGLKDDGTWSGIDYPSQTRGFWSPRYHLSRLLEIAKYYQTPGNELYQKKEVSKKLHAALNYWLDNDFQSPNWWHPVIGTPMLLNPILILLEPELSEEQLQKAMPILNRCEIGRTGQNKVWQSGNVLFTSLLIRDVEMVKRAASSIQEELVVSTNEGVQPDWSYHQHGPQLQFGNYGLSYVGDMITWISILRETQFQFDEGKVEILRNYLLDGLQWVTWKGQMDISACGRQLFIDSPEQKAQSLDTYFSKMERIDPGFNSDFRNEYKKENIENSILKANHFWRSDFQVHRNNKYYFSVKMCSNRVIGAESCNSENIQGYYMGDGATFLYQSGEEYRNIFPFWDWKKIPGTTTQQDNDTLPVLTASGYRIESDFVGGMIGFPTGNYQNSVAAMVYNRNGLQARKAWFMFDDMVVCLGNSISTKTGLPVTTSINQVFLNKQSPFETGFGKIPEKMEFWGKSSWIVHDSVGYFFPDGGKVKVETNPVEGSWNWVANRYPNKLEQADIFKLYLDHGTNPDNGSYEYVIIPNATVSKMKEIAGDFPLRFINEKNKQEVISGDGKSTAVVFYEPGKSDALGGIEVDKPCIVVITEIANATLVRVADPTQKLNEIKMKLNDKWQIKNMKTVGNENTALIQFYPEDDLVKSFQFSITKK